MVSKMATQESECFSLTDLFSGRPSIKTAGFFFSLKVCSGPFRGEVCEFKNCFL